ncbi:DUF6056 family protein [Streptomyces sp. NPDC088762]|uniref:DUF6056 family protein n=1 Tax=Streptomyces sp. NPDC088762 TaxID=3365891 RepID=UPI003807F399
MRTAATEGERADRTEGGPEGGKEGRPGTRPPGALRGLLPAVAAILAVAAGGLIAVGCFLGLYVRPTSDDWCVAWKARDLGVGGITADFYTTQNGRIANALLSGIIYGDGLAGPKVLPTVIAVTFTAGLVLLGREFIRFRGGTPRPSALPALVACALVVQALLYYGGPRSYQVLLWAPATISHTIPSVIGLWTLLLGIRTARSPRPGARRAGLASALLAGCVLGTLSEPFALVSGLLAAAAGLLALPRLRLARTWHPFTWCLCYCSGLVCGLVVLYTSPGARWRRAQQPAKESLLSAGELGGTAGDWLRMWDAIAGQWAHLGAAAVGVLLGLCLAAPAGRGRGRRAPVPRKTALALLLLPVPVVALGSFAVVVGLRSGYGPSGWTYARTWTSHLVLMDLALCAYGALLGQWAAGRLPARRRHTGPAAVGAGVLVLVTLAALVPSVQRLTTDTVTHAVAWDAQDSRIRAESARGARDVGYRPLYTGGLAEPFFTSAYARDWVAACVSRWYGVDRIHRR